jgi:serine/threonine-protein kinase
MRPVEGLALGDRYRLTRRIAVGGMGEVWVADDTFLGREVAVKVLREEYTGQEDFLARLRTEARNSAALSHPNIAQMYDYGEQAGTGYLVMELVVGEPLADLLEREPVLAPKRLLPILAATARGLHAAHEAHVVHRDVKPGNILLEHPTRASGGRTTVKITDFGVSLAANQAPMTAAGMVMGTAQYLSPEQAVGQPATPLSDVYALGVVAYEATAGKRPFTGVTPVDIAVAHVNNPVPPLPSSVHPGLSAVIMRMLEKDPSLRPVSAGALADELDGLARDIAADPLGARSRTARRLQGSGAAAATAAGTASGSTSSSPSARSARSASSAPRGAHAARHSGPPTPVAGTRGVGSGAGTGSPGTPGTPTPGSGGAVPDGKTDGRTDGRTDGATHRADAGGSPSGAATPPWLPRAADERPYPPRRVLHAQGTDSRRAPASRRADRAEASRATAESTRPARTRAEQTRSRAEAAHPNGSRAAQRRGEHLGTGARTTRTPGAGNGTPDRTRAAVRARTDDRGRAGARSVPLPDRGRRARTQEAEAPRRTSTTTGVRLGPLGRLSWPLVALLALLAVLLVASFVRSLLDDGGGASAAALPAAAALARPRARSGATRRTLARRRPALPVPPLPTVTSTTTVSRPPVAVLDPAQAWDRAGFGMMDPHESRAEHATPTPKDV